MDTQQFWAEYEGLAEEASQRAHHIAMLVLQDENSDIDPGIRLDYAHALNAFLGFLADQGFSDPSHTFVRTASNGPVAIEPDPEDTEVFRVYRFDRIELDPEDVPDEDKATIITAYEKLLSH